VEGLMRRCLAAGLGSLLLVLAACGGSGGARSNGIAAKSENAIMSATFAAAAGLHSVHVWGWIDTGRRITFDLALVNGEGGKGSMSLNGFSLKIVVARQQIYISANRSFWRRFAGSAGAELFERRWLKVPDSGQYAPIAAVTNLQGLLHRFLSTRNILVKGPLTTIRGQQVIAIEQHTLIDNRTLYAATTGKPYPIEFVESGVDFASIHFDRFDQAVALVQPADAIDITKLNRS
jgi:hypothetical protein